MEQLLKNIDYGLETEKATGEEGAMKKRAHLIQRLMKLNVGKSGDDDDDLYIPSPEHVQEVQTPSSEGRKKSSARKRVVSPTVRTLKIKLIPKPAPEPQQTIHDPIHSPPKQPSPPHQQSPQSSPQLRMSTPTHEQPIITSPHILQTPPTTQPPVQTTPGSSSLKDFPPVPENIALEDIGDFNFVTDVVVKRLQKKVEVVLVDKKKMEDREKKLEDRVKSVEAENSSLLKKIAEIDILKVGIAELEEEKARRDEQNEYFKLKNKELEDNNAKKEHEMYMMNKVLENLIGKPVEQRFEEIELEEVRARRKVEIEAEMKNKGKGVQIESVAEASERAIIVSEPTEDPETSILNPCPISLASGALDDDVFDDDIEDDDEEEEDDILKDDAEDVYSASGDDNDDGNDDDDKGSIGLKVTETSNEEKIDEYLHDDTNEEPENAESEGELDDTEKDDENVDHVSRLIILLEHGVEEGEILHTYTLAEIIKMTHVDENEFKYDFEEELNQFDIN
ncbi:hypothetical protein Hanom_Chr17g01572221 [Helianthus anomalus]